MEDNNYEDRVRLTSSCRDCDNLDKVRKAGQILTGSCGERYQYMFNGVKILYGTYHSPWMNRIIKNLKGHHEPQEELCFFYLLKTLGKKANMLELGSNWSYYSIWFNKKVKYPRNICIEPIWENLKNGKLNSNFNNCRNIKFIQACIGKEFSQNTIFKNWDGELIKLPQYSVEYVVKSNKNLYLDIIHSDIQGAELDMLKGAQSVFDNIGYFVISTHRGKHDECIKFLRNNHFIILVEHSVEESYSSDGLIVAINRRNVKRYEENISGSLSIYFRNNCIISRREA